MPVIEMYLPAGAVDQETKAALQARVSRRVMEAEGADWDNELGRNITWAIIHEVPAGNWAVAGQPLDGEPRVLARVTVPEDAVNPEKRAAIARAVQEELVAALGEVLSDVTKSFLVIVDQPFAAGGQMVDYQRLIAALDAARSSV